MPSLNNQITQEMIDEDVAAVREMSFDGVYINTFKKIDVFDVVVVERVKKESAIKRFMADEGDYITIAKGQTSDGKDAFKFYRIPNGTSLENVDDEDFLVDEESGILDYTIRDANQWFEKKNSKELTAPSLSGQTTNVYESNFFLNFLDDYQPGVESDDYFVSDQGLVYVKVPEGKCFLMGDNRAYSTDSRENGFANKKDLVGKAEFYVLNYNLVNRIVEVVKFYFGEIQIFFAR